MKTSTHPVERDEVMALLDGELSPERAEMISAHVHDCAMCAETTAQLRGASELLASWRVKAAPDSIEKRVLRERLGASDPKPYAQRSRWKKPAWAAAIVVASLALLVLVSGRYGYQPIRKPRPKTVLERQGYKSWVADGKLATDQVSNGRAVNGRSLNSLVTLSTPGVAADSNGLPHGFGDHIESGFTVDGQPRTDQQSKVFSDAIPAPMIARTVSLSVVVKDFGSSRTAMEAILKQYHGYSAQLEVSTPENAARSLQASLRIPSAELGPAVAALKALGRVENESQSGEEVTQQHADLVARLKNARETEERFRAILQQRTGNVSEVLQVEEGIARVRSEIERMEAEQKNLEHRVDFVAVNLQLVEEYKAQLNPSSPSIAVRFHNALVEGYQNAGATVLGIVLFFAEYTLTLLIWGAIVTVPLIWAWRRFRRALATI
jgi:hypothetical protein